MKTFFRHTTAICALTLFLGFAALAQSGSNTENSAAGALLKGSGKVAVVIVGTAAKSAWVVTKFSAKHLAKPTAKFFLLKAPAAALKMSGRTTKRLLPVAVKLSKAYLKTKLPI